MKFGFMRLFVVVQYFYLAENQCEPQLCLPQDTQRIKVGIVNDAKNTCIELFNNSVVLDVASRILHDHRCGIRCAGRNTQMASWQKPTSSRLIEQGSVAYRRDLTRYGSTTYSDNYDKGIYTCLVDNTYKLHIGIYNSDPGGPRVMLMVNKTDSYMDFNCTSTGSPATDVMWLRNDVIIQAVTQQIIRDRHSSTYENLIRIPISELSTGRYSCNVSNVIGWDEDHTEIIATLQLPVVTVNETTGDISWTLIKNVSSSDDSTVVYIQAMGYTIEISGGNCLKDDPIKMNITRTKYHIQPDSECQDSIDADNRLHSGANYTIRIKALNHATNTAGNFSDPKWISTTTRVPCGIPQNFTARRMGISSLALFWSRVECYKQNGVILNYNVHRLRDSHTISKVVIASGEINSEVFSRLCPFLKYEFRTAAVNIAGAGPNATVEERILTDGEIAGISVGCCALLCLLLCFICCCICWRTRRRQNQRSSPLILHDVNYEIEMEDTVDYGLEENLSLEPVISIFPDNMLVCLGEYVIMYISVHGNPPPTLSWYHNDQNIYNDSTIEISEDGTLSIPSMEARHIGDYRLVATNEHGSCEMEMELHLESEDTPNLSRALSMSLLIDTAPVPVSSLEEYVASHHSKSNDPFRCEFLSLNSENNGETKVGEMPQNKALNRFKHIVPYDDNRVILKPISGFDDCQHDYINASYVDGHNLQNAFIAAQGPLPHTMIDFWRMVWQERVTLIIMLCNTVEGHRVRCQQYWPSSGSQNYGPFCIKLETQDRFADYTLRTFEIKFSATSTDSKLIKHYQFTSWPDNLLPENSSSLLAMHNKALSNLSLEGPILVHCSAGVGRTGAFIAMDRALEQAKEGVVDVMGIVNGMRQQRIKMVQTLAQYIDIYDSVLEHVVCGETKIDAVDLRVALKILRTVDQNTGQTTLEKQFQVLREITPSPLEVDRNVAAKNRDLNRSMEFLPRDTKRVVLYGGGDDYIHATFVDGYKHKKAFIVTQGPQVDTCNEFWKMIHQYNCGTIVMLSDLIEYNKEVCYPYWPKVGSEDYGDYNVEFVGESTYENLNTREFNLTCTSKENKNEKPHPVTQFHILNWMPDGQCSNLVTITRLLDEVTRNQIKTGNHPIVVHCSDTVGRSAIFCAALTAIEQCKTEVAIDIFHAVKGIRMQKPGAVVSAEQYSMIFEVVLTYLDSIDNYANFN